MLGYPLEREGAITTFVVTLILHKLLFLSIDGILDVSPFTTRNTSFKFITFSSQGSNSSWHWNP
jgi:hypothetical protein